MIPKTKQNAIIANVQRLLVESGIPNLQMMAVDADDLIQRVDDYQQQAQAKYGNRTVEQIAAFVYQDIAYDYGQSDAGM